MKRVIIGENQTINRPVCLPTHGNLKVRVGEMVEFGNLIAESSQPERFEVIDIPSHFNLSPEQAEGTIKRLLGDVIAKGDVLAQKDGFITQLFRSPGDGKVVSLRDGRITLAIGLEKEQVFAPMPGVVAELLGTRGAMISLTGTVVESAWGNGKVAQGELAFWEDLETNLLGVPGEMVKDKLIAFKKFATAGQIRRVLRLKPAGLILPSVSYKQLSLVSELDIAVISLLGFGETNMDTASMAMLETMAGKTVCLLAEESTWGPKLSPLLILPADKPADLGLTRQTARLEAGAKVRLMGKPYMGMVGTVKALPKQPAIFASGLQSPVVELLCDDDQVINASIHNVELIQS